MSTPALCHAWRHATLHLMEGSLDPRWATVVRRRGELLGELEHRDKDGFARWIAAGAHDGSNPAYHIRGKEI
ncbi:hypothetical protein [Pseudonocardia ailaonensis]